jgi:small subunit ribosomal protein S18
MMLSKQNRHLVHQLLLVHYQIPQLIFAEPISRNSGIFIKRKVEAARKPFEDFVGTVLPEPKKNSQQKPLRLKVPLSKERLEHYLDVKIARLRGGIPRFDGAAEISFETLPESIPDHAPPTWEDYYDFIEKSIPSVSQNFRRTINADSANWLFEKPAPATESPNSEFERAIPDWRSGKLMTEQYKKDSFARTFADLPAFRTKPPDPFAQKQHQLVKISWKNPHLLTKFLTPGGQLLPTRVTGVRRRTQKKLSTEVKKARFLGILSFTGNPEYNNPYNRPNKESSESQDVDIGASEVTTRPQNHMKVYLDNLVKGIAPTGTLEWDPPKSVTNPHHSSKYDDISEKGHMPEQRQKKKELLRKLLKENVVLSNVVGKKALEPRNLNDVRRIVPVPNNQ